MERSERSATPRPMDDASERRPRILVIAGWGRSGSTILANILGSTAGVVTLGEVNNLWERGFGDDLNCSGGEPFSCCPAWKPIAASAFGEPAAEVAGQARTASRRLGNTWLIQRRLPGWGPRVTGRADRYAELLAHLYHAAFAETGARLLVDASKSPWHCAVAASLRDSTCSCSI